MAGRKKRECRFSYTGRKSRLLTRASAGAPPLSRVFMDMDLRYEEQAIKAVEPLRARAGALKRMTHRGAGLQRMSAAGRPANHIMSAAIYALAPYFRNPTAVGKCWIQKTLNLAEGVCRGAPCGYQVGSATQGAKHPRG